MNRIAGAMAVVATSLGTTAGTAMAEPPHLTIPRVARAPQLDDFAAMDADDAAATLIAALKGPRHTYRGADRPRHTQRSQGCGW